MKADFGGTEILPAIKSTIERRLKDLNLEIMVLTDGQVWNSEDLFKYVEKETEKGTCACSVWQLGIGRDVSHSPIDGLARVGRGFSQVVSDEREGMESKVARMLLCQQHLRRVCILQNLSLNRNRDTYLFDSAPSQPSQL